MNAPARAAFSGPRMVVIAFTTQGIAIAFTIGTFGLFLEPMEAAFGASRAEVSLGLALMNLFMNLSMPFVGRALDQRSIRHIMALGAALNGLAFVLIAGASALWQMLAAFALFASVGTAMLGPVAGSTLMANWFDARRGQALGMVNMGAPASIMLMAPVVSFGIGALGWRGTLLAYAAITLSVALPAAWFGVVNRPSDLGQRPDGGDDGDGGDGGMQSAAPGGAELAGRSWTTAALLSSRAFWALAVATAIPIAASVVLVTHLVAFARDLGASDGAAAALLSVQAGAALTGTLLLGWLSDRMSSKWLLAASIIVQAMVVASFFSAPSYPILLVSVGVIGMCFGGMMPLLGALIGQHFGASAFGQVLGMAFLVQLPFSFVGPPLGGAIFDRDGSYAGLFVILGVAYAVALLTLLLLPRRTEEKA